MKTLEIASLFLASFVVGYFAMLLLSRRSLYRRLRDGHRMNKAWPRSILLAMLCISLAVGVSGCSSPAKAAYSTLATIGAAENGAMKVAATAEVNHQITEAQWQQIAAKHALFLVSYDAACNAAAVALDQAAVPANVASLEADILNLVTTFTQPSK